MVVDCCSFVKLDEGEDSGVKIDLERFHLEQQVFWTFLCITQTDTIRVTQRNIHQSFDETLSSRCGFGSSENRGWHGRWSRFQYLWIICRRPKQKRINRADWLPGTHYSYFLFYWGQDTIKKLEEFLVDDAQLYKPEGIVGWIKRTTQM